MRKSGLPPQCFSLRNFFLKEQLVHVNFPCEESSEGKKAPRSMSLWNPFFRKALNPKTNLGETPMTRSIPPPCAPFCIVPLRCVLSRWHSFVRFWIMFDDHSFRWKIVILKKINFFLEKMGSPNCPLGDYILSWPDSGCTANGQHRRVHKDDILVTRTRNIVLNCLCQKFAHKYVYDVFNPSLPQMRGFPHRPILEPISHFQVGVPYQQSAKRNQRKLTNR